MKLLLTGANGLVGRACQIYAKKFNCDTTIISSKKPLYKNFKCYKKLEDIPKELNHYFSKIKTKPIPLNKSKLDRTIKEIEDKCGAQRYRPRRAPHGRLSLALR